MNDYYEVRYTVTPPSETACDLLAAALGEAGYESFVPADDFSALTAYVPAAAFDEAAAAAAATELPEGFRASFEAELVPGRDWNAEWEKNYFKPINIGKKVVICSTFHTDVPEAEIKIFINPKMAFGTGHHATTVLMMSSLLDAPDIAGATVVDMGTGTGILGILARKLGAKQVLAVEIDPFAATNAEENIALNLPADSGIELVCSDAAALDGRGEFADVFLANINRNIIVNDIKRYSDALKPGGRLTVSGFYVEDRAVVEAAALVVGLVPAGTGDFDNWASISFRKDPAAAYFKAGRNAWQAGDIAAAISAYTKAVELDPDGSAAVALQQAREIMNFRHKDLYNP